MCRGQALLKVKELEVEVWPKRSFNRYTERLQVCLSDLQFTKSVQLSQKQTKPARLLQEVTLRRLILQKVPCKQFESALVHFPLIEI